MTPAPATPPLPSAQQYTQQHQKTPASSAAASTAASAVSWTSSVEGVDMRTPSRAKTEMPHTPAEAPTYEAHAPQKRVPATPQPATGASATPTIAATSPPTAMRAATRATLTVPPPGSPLGPGMVFAWARAGTQAAAAVGGAHGGGAAPSPRSCAPSRSGIAALAGRVWPNKERWCLAPGAEVGTAVSKGLWVSYLPNANLTSLPRVKAIRCRFRHGDAWHRLVASGNTTAEEWCVLDLTPAARSAANVPAAAVAELIVDFDSGNAVDGVLVTSYNPCAKVSVALGGIASVAEQQVLQPLSGEQIAQIVTRAANSSGTSDASNGSADSAGSSGGRTDGGALLAATRQLRLRMEGVLKGADGTHHALGAMADAAGQCAGSAAAAAENVVGGVRAVQQQPVRRRLL